jgi:Protein of unknown function (DUF3553)
LINPSPRAPHKTLDFIPGIERHRAGRLRMQYKKGLRVKNPYAPDWGIGEVLEDTAGNTVSVFFVDAGQKTCP